MRKVTLDKYNSYSQKLKIDDKGDSTDSDDYRKVNKRKQDQTYYSIQDKLVNKRADQYSNIQ